MTGFSHSGLARRLTSSVVAQSATMLSEKTLTEAPIALRPEDPLLGVDAG